MSKASLSSICLRMRLFSTVVFKGNLPMFSWGLEQMEVVELGTENGMDSNNFGS